MSQIFTSDVFDVTANTKLTSSISSNMQHLHMGCDRVDWSCGHVKVSFAVQLVGSVLPRILVPYESRSTSCSPQQLKNDSESVDAVLWPTAMSKVVPRTMRIAAFRLLTLRTCIALPSSDPAERFKFSIRSGRALHAMSDLRNQHARHSPSEALSATPRLGTAMSAARMKTQTSSPEPNPTPS